MLTSFLRQVSDLDEGTLSPQRFCRALNIGIGTLAHVTQINRTTLTRAPESEKVQASLGEIARIIGMATVLTQNSPNQAILWFRHQPLPAFDLKTAETLVAEGHGGAVIKHLEMLSDGVYA